MEQLFIPVKDEIPLELTKEVIDTLKDKTVGLITTIQHLHKLKDINLPKKIIGGQILGCDLLSAVKIIDGSDCFLYIGSGKFHPIEVAIKTEKEVYTFDPYTKEFSKLDKEIERIKKKRKGALIKYLSAETIGILVSTKPGQNQIEFARELKELTKKKSYIFIADTFSPESLEAFPFIEVFVNTACPRISEDDYPKAIINLEDVPELNNYDMY